MGLRAIFRYLGIALGIVLCVMSLYATAVILLRGWPQALPGLGSVPLAHIFAMPGIVATVSGLLLFNLLAGLAGKKRHSRPWQIVSVVVLVSTLTQWGLIIGRGAGADQLSDVPTASTAEISVLTWNTTNRADADHLLRLIRHLQPDVAVFPETDVGRVNKALQQLDATTRYQVFAADRGGRSGATTVIVAARLGAYQQVPAPETEYGLVVLEPVGAPIARPRILGVHTVPYWGFSRQRWQAEVRTVLDLARCTGTESVIVAGNLNTTEFHPSLDRRAPCVDAVAAVGPSAAGTWPSGMTAIFGARIDHVLVSDDLKPQSARVINLWESRHRAVWVSLASPVQLPVVTSAG